MTRPTFAALSLAAVLASVTGGCMTHEPLAPPAALPSHVATQPVAREDAWWQERHALLSVRAQTGPRLVFLGDSITQSWEAAGQDAWEAAYAGRDAVNLGISGDRTQHVLWRLANGSLPSGAPELVVLMIGTNNSNDDAPDTIADGVTAIVDRLWTALPETEVLVLSIFPRGADPSDRKRLVNDGANARIAELPARYADGRVRTLDIARSFVDPDGRLPEAIMPDLLHLSPEGYARWARAVEAEVARALGDEARTL